MNSTKLVGTFNLGVVISAGKSRQLWNRSYWWANITCIVSLLFIQDKLHSFHTLFQIGMTESNWESKLDYDSLWIRNPLKCYCCVCIYAGSIPDNKKCRPLTTEVISNNATATTPEARFDHQTQPTNGCPAGIKHACIYTYNTNNVMTVLIVLMSPPPPIQFKI